MASDPQALEDAIDFGNLSAQHAPAGSAIFQALDAAEAVRRSGSRDEDEIGTAISRIYDAAADIRNDPDAPLPKTIFSVKPGTIPWGPIALVGGAAVLAFFIFKGPGARS